MKLLGEPGSQELFRTTLYASGPWDESDTKFVFHYIFDAANAYIDSSGDAEALKADCGSLGAFSYAVDRIVDWCFQNGIDAQPFWDAWLLLDYLLGGDSSVTLKDVQRAFDRAVTVIRRLDPIYKRTGKAKAIPLSDPQKAIIATLREVGHPMHTEEFLTAMDNKGLPSSSNVKTQFAFLVQIGELTKVAGGYGLPEWADKS